MTTTTEQTTLLWHIVKASPLAGIISGSVYKLQRPTDSKLEDIVVNAITIDSELVQTGVANLNIHVPDLVNGMPNTARIEQLESIAKGIILKGWGSNYTFFIENQQTIQDQDAADNWFINFRIRFKFHNT